MSDSKEYWNVFANLEIGVYEELRRTNFPNEQEFHNLLAALVELDLLRKLSGFHIETEGSGLSAHYSDMDSFPGTPSYMILGDRVETEKD